MNGPSGGIRFGRYRIGGGEPLYELPLIDVSRRRTTLMFPPGVGLRFGDMFDVLRPVLTGGDYTMRPGRPREIVARVKILDVDDGNLAIVQVVEGDVIRGYWAQRCSQERDPSRRGRSLNIPDFFSILRPDHLSGR